MGATMLSASDTKSLERCINDLIGILALPALWVGADSRKILEVLLDTLVSMLDLDFVYARVRSSDHTFIRSVRVASDFDPNVDLLGRLDGLFGAAPQSWGSKTSERIGETLFALVPLPLGPLSGPGILIAGCARSGFPRDTDLLLLTVAANQAALSLQDARLMLERERLAEELERRVAERTDELTGVVQELELRVRMLQEMPVVAWSVRPDGTPDLVNNGWTQYTGQTNEDLRSRPEHWVTALHPDDQVRVPELVWESLRNGSIFETEARFRRASDGSYRWHLTRGVPVRDSEGKLLRIIGTSTDIQELKEVQELARASELGLLQMIETIPGMLWSATPDGAIDYCNGRLLSYAGFSAHEVLGANWVRLLHPDDVVPTVEVWKECIRTGAPYRVEVRTYFAADGSYRWCVTDALPLRDGEGNIVKWYGTVVDIHDSKVAEEELRTTQSELAYVARVMTVGELTASIAHELNQPLAGIMTNAGSSLLMLESDPPNIAGALQAANRTIRDANRAAQVITRLRALFQRRQLTSEQVDLNEAAREVLLLCRSSLERNRVSTRLDLASDLPAIMGDRVQLQQVILNLIGNAIDAMSGIEHRPRELTLKTERDGSAWVSLTVSDTGVGFRAEDADAMFAAFYTTKESGMGIGLSVSRTIIQSHDGKISARPNAECGASFSFQIPSRSHPL